MSVASVFSNRDLLDRILRSAPVTEEGVEQLRRIKAVCKLWCRVARHVITDSEWFDSSSTHAPLCSWEWLLDESDGLRLPLQFTLHPECYGHTETGGYGSSAPDPGPRTLRRGAPDPGNPLCSVVGTLRDLVLVQHATDSIHGHPYSIARMVLSVTGIEEPFDTAWGAMATQFKLDHACMYEVDLAGRSMMKDELFLINIGFNLQNKFWQPLDSIGMLIVRSAEKLYRSDGSSCIVENYP